MFNRLKRIFKQADGVPDYHLSPVFDTSGAGRFVLNAEFGLPSQFYNGRGRLAGALRVMQTPQVYVALSAKQAGIGGLQAGTIELQPLTTQDNLGR